LRIAQFHCDFLNFGTNAKIWLAISGINVLISEFDRPAEIAVAFCALDCAGWHTTAICASATDYETTLGPRNVEDIDVEDTADWFDVDVDVRGG
jgi:hypothetical protein